MTHICVSKLTITGADNGLSPDQRQAIICTNAGILLIGPLGTHVSEILIEIYIFSFKKMHLKLSSENWRPFCLNAWSSTHRHQLTLVLITRGTWRVSARQNGVNLMFWLNLQYLFNSWIYFFGNCPLLPRFNWLLLVSLCIISFRNPSLQDSCTLSLPTGPGASRAGWLKVSPTLTRTRPIMRFTVTFPAAVRSIGFLG